MKKISCLLLLILTTCCKQEEVPPPKPLAVNVRPHICRTASIGVLEGISDKANMAARAAADYWNNTLGCPVFIFEYKQIPDILVWDKQRLPINIEQDIDNLFKKLPHAMGCIEYVAEKTTGCIASAVIYMRHSYIKKGSMEFIESLYRHELGHALGLQDEMLIKGELMSPLSKKAHHPLEAKEQDIRRLRLMYCPNGQW